MSALHFEDAGNLLSHQRLYFRVEYALNASRTYDPFYIRDSLSQVGMKQGTPDFSLSVENVAGVIETSKLKHKSQLFPLDLFKCGCILHRNMGTRPPVPNLSHFDAWPNWCCSSMSGENL